MTRDMAEQIMARHCDGKLAYSPSTAQSVARRQTAESGERIVAYRCVMCGEPVWHIGHAQSIENMADTLEALRVLSDCAPEPARLPSAHERRRMRSAARKSLAATDRAGAA